MLSIIAGGAIAGHPVSQGAGEAMAFIFIGLVLFGFARLMTKARS